ncbi:hypothetical protein BOW53_00405 [Solemya pervernicosa gill symbiont]|uniref:Carrier domain-containing protein n=1 Tax=Solemya pervernicosa gill symbiont TaxID=642797 RepID=A0A1T2LBM0_9GAMM|nr:acyl carrier protein [Solemya pervernicosa gill symbiont]OOZ42336.1 hypothetical protein BOW53_00405 [Solemya pervernicosa gill symbiont]
MDSALFLENIHEALNNQVDELTLETAFQELEKWDSLASVSTVAMIYAEYDVQVSGDELLSCKTLGELKNKIVQKQQMLS